MFINTDTKVSIPGLLSTLQSIPTLPTYLIPNICYSSKAGDWFVSFYKRNYLLRYLYLTYLVMPERAASQ